MRGGRPSSVFRTCTSVGAVHAPVSALTLRGCWDPHMYQDVLMRHDRAGRMAQRSAVRPPPITAVSFGGVQQGRAARSSTAAQRGQCRHLLSIKPPGQFRQLEAGVLEAGVGLGAWHAAVIFWRPGMCRQRLGPASSRSHAASYDAGLTAALSSCIILQECSLTAPTCCVSQTW